MSGQFELLKAIEISLKTISWKCLKIKSHISCLTKSYDVVKFYKDAKGYVIESCFINLTGTYGPLPLSDTERFLNSSYREEFFEFLDLFHKQLYRAWYRSESHEEFFFIHNIIKKVFPKKTVIDLEVF